LVGQRFQRPLQIVGGHRSFGCLKAVVERPCRLEKRIESKDEVTAQQSLLTAPLAGEVEGLFEGGQDPVLDLCRQAGITGVSHVYEGS
jgi:hypothetical protein